MRVYVETGKLDLGDVKLGDSIAVNGVCLTAVELPGDGFWADVSRETLTRTAFVDLKAGSRVNLEKALTPTTRLGGHLVSGHVDGVGEIVKREDNARAIQFSVRAPRELAKYIALKGSITVDGTSLTVNAVNGAEFELTIVPHTLVETIMADYRPGRRVNLEVDLLARYLERLLLGDKAAEARIGFLDLNASQVAVDYLRDQGFMQGFGIDVKNPKVIGDEDDKRIVGHAYTDGAEEGGRKAMETILQIDPKVNVVYTINEPAAAGAYEALKAVGREKDVLIVSVDGGCPGVQNVKDGIIGATSQQYPLLMASKGIEAIAAFAKDGTKPTATEGKNFVDTGVTLVTDKPVAGIESIDTTKGAELCWG